MHTTTDVHLQFASFFKSETLQPYAYLLSKLLSEGNICLKLDDVERLKDDLPQAYRTALDKRKRLEDEPLVALGGEARQPFVLYNNRLYLHRYFTYESVVLTRIREFAQTEAAQLDERALALSSLLDFIKGLFARGATPDLFTDADPDWQLVAAINAVLNNFTVITGGPGTGKTTTVARILAILYKTNPNLRVALAAPTGKAAARMAESLKSAIVAGDDTLTEKFKALEPSTIHRLLKYIPDSFYFGHNRTNPLNVDVVVVDESSMIDVALFAKLFDAIAPGTRLIMLGDKDQLASVEAGSLFGDLCQAQGQLNIFSRQRAELINSLTGNAQQLPARYIADSSGHPLFQHVVELKKSHRFRGDEGIGRFSRAVIGNDERVLRDFIQIPDQQVRIDTGYSKQLFEAFADGYSDFISEPDIAVALRKLNDLRILCAVREGEFGLYQTNKKVERYLEQKKLIRLTGEFYINRPVMVTGNNYTAGLFNGDTGIVRPDEGGTLKVWFENSEGQIHAVLPAYISHLETVFAMTIHKSQGSEFNKVLVMLPTEEDIAILTRELLYTAITRARTHISIQGSESVILKASERSVKRASGIASRFNH